MKIIESANQRPSEGLTREIQNFWTRNVNAESILGKRITEFERGSHEYFQDLENQRYRSHRHLLPWITAMKKNCSVLEIGCGIGLDSFLMAKHGLRLTSIDLTHIAVKTASERFCRGQLDTDFVVADAENLPFPDQCFDYVYSFGVLHHVSDTERSLDEVYRVLKKNGEARVMLYNRISLNELVHQLTRIPFEDADEVCPVARRFTKAEVRKMMARFSQVTMELKYAFGEGYGILFRIIPGWLYDLVSRYFGWHIMIIAVK